MQPGSTSASLFAFGPVEQLLAQRAVSVPSETVRQWCLKCGQRYANEVRRRRPRCGDTWHLDEGMLTIRGQKQCLWRAVDQHGNVLDIWVQSRRNPQSGQAIFPQIARMGCNTSRV